ncbi:protein enabled homolog isoform X2 [Rhodamnia argentea]|uniref:Protein enabled homolog isoform X2 n=1 Tax=Rhodamnia argentea TaxID=178133 RepID=A0A8B8QRW1_9MYRT|nr:protein enabled homolog isoform X2 [Rhodamnia argentea]
MGMEELRQALLYTTFELQTTIASAKEEISGRELEMIQIKDLLTRTMKERDGAQSRCEELQLEKLILQQQLSRKEQPKLAAAPSPRKTSSGDDEAMLVSSGVSNSPLSPSSPQPPALPVPKVALELAVQKPLPPKGKLLQAVMEAGPLLQTLLLAGPLPQWEHPPPPLDSTEIPPVAIPSPSSSAKFNGGFGNKRSSECSETSESPKNKHQKLILH